MSLLQKASIITTPTAYAEDYLYSIKPAIPYGDELVSSWTNNDFSSFSSNGTTITQMVSSGSGNNCYSLATFESGKTYELQFTISQNITAQIRISNNINLTSAQVVLSNPTSGLNSVIFTANANYVYVGVYGAASFTDTQITKFTLRERTDADFDFDRNSTGTRVNEDYLIEDVPYNLIPYSEEVDNGAWDKVGVTIGANVISAPDGTLTADKLKENSGGTYHNTNHDDTVNGGIKYTASAFFKLAERTTASIYENLTAGGGNYYLSSFNLSNGTVDTQHANHIAKIEAAGNGWYRCSITFTPNATRSASLYYAPNNQLTYTGVTDNGVYMWGAQFVKGDQPKDYLKTTDRLDIPRIDYTNGEPSILLEPSRTNLVSNSNNPYSLEQVTKTSVLSPEGINNAFRLTETTANAQHYASILSSVTSGVVHSISFFIKKGNGYTTATIYTQAVRINSNVTVNFETKSITLAGTHIVAGSEKLETYPNGWFRVSYSATPIATGSMYIYAGVKDISTYIGSTDNYIDYYGFQVEVGSYATSLIHTSGSTVTRSKDSFPNPLGANGTPTGNKAVIYLEIASTVTTPLPQKNFIGFVNGTTNQYGLYHWGQTDSNKFGFNTWNGDAYGITGADYLINGEFNKIAGLFDFTRFYKQQTIYKRKKTEHQSSKKYYCTKKCSRFRNNSTNSKSRPCW